MTRIDKELETYRLIRRYLVRDLLGDVVPLENLDCIASYDHNVVMPHYDIVVMEQGDLRQKNIFPCSVRLSAALRQADYLRATGKVVSHLIQIDGPTWEQIVQTYDEQHRQK